MGFLVFPNAPRQQQILLELDDLAPELVLVNRRLGLRARIIVPKLFRLFEILCIDLFVLDELAQPIVLLHLAGFKPPQTGQNGLKRRDNGLGR